MMKKLYQILLPLIALYIFSDAGVFAQKSVVIDGYKVHPVTIIDGDTLANVLIPQIVVFPTRDFSSRRDYRRYQRLVRNLKVVYPYAQIAKYKISEMDTHYRTIENEVERKAYIKQVESELRAEFEDQLVKLTISQGRLLIKLIDREVGRTSYAVIRDLRGGASAVFWQAVARIFGSNLKTEFGLADEDKILNELIILYEHGLL